MATIGSLMIETGLTTVGLKRDLDQAVSLTEQGARRMKQVLDEFGRPAWSGFEESSQRAVMSARDVEQGLRTTARSARALALPLANELAPALGATVAQMTQVTTMSLSIARGFGGIALAGAGIAGVLAGQLLSAWQANIQAKRDFDMAMRTGDIGAMGEQARKSAAQVMELHDEVVKLSRIQDQMKGKRFEDAREALGGIRGGVEDQRAAEARRLAQQRERAETEKAAQEFMAAEQRAVEGVPGVQAREQEAAFQQRQASREKARQQAEQDADKRSRDIAARAQQDAALLESFRRDDLADSAAAYRAKEALDEQYRQNKQQEEDAARQHARSEEEFLLNESLRQAQYRNQEMEKIRKENEDAESEGRRAREAEEAFLLSETLDQQRYRDQQAEKRTAELDRESREWGRLFSVVGYGLSDLVTQTGDFGDAVVRMGERVASTFLDMVISRGLQPAEEAFAAFISQATRAGGGYLGGLFSSPTPGAGTPAVGAIDAGGYGYMAAGGIVTRPTRAIIGEAGPEAVVPLDQYRRGGGETTVIINDQRGAQAAPVQVRESQQDDRKMIEILIADTVNKTLASGHHDRVLQTTYGINRRGRS